jgi:isopenicillin-N epimerase
VKSEFTLHSLSLKGVVLSVSSNFRDQFLLDPDVVFLNHGSFGATPRSVFEKYQAFQLELEREPVEFLGRRFNDLMRAAREPLAAYLNAAPDEIVYVPNATTGLNVVARSLDLKPGDEILSTNHEYGALDRTWRFLCGKTGATYINHTLPDPLESREQVVESLWSRVTDRTRVIFLSHITSPTALLFPVEEICARARSAGILTMIDGAHAPGQIPLDLKLIDADFYSGNCHKWMCAPKGSAFLYARKDKQSLVEPLIVSWGYESEMPSDSKFIDQHEWLGTRDYAPYLATPAAIEFMAQYDWSSVQHDCRLLAREAQRRITDFSGGDPLTTKAYPNDLQMLTAPLPPCDPVVTQRRLFAEHHIEIPFIAWGNRQWIRVSIQAYNSPDDVDRLIGALRDIF